jgi:hypothetical protein
MRAGDGPPSGVQVQGFQALKLSGTASRTLDCNRAITVKNISL